MRKKYFQGIYERRNPAALTFYLNSETPKIDTVSSESGVPMILDHAIEFKHKNYFVADLFFASDRVMMSKSYPGGSP